MRLLRIPFLRRRRARRLAARLAPYRPAAAERETAMSIDSRRPRQGRLMADRVVTAAEALAWAVDRLDSEEHRYVERFAPCPNGCEFDHQGDWSRRPVRTAGPADCTACDDGILEDEDAAHIDPEIDALRRLAEALQ